MDASVKYYRNQEIVCPYCDYEFKDSFDVALELEDGDEAEEECPECGEDFIVRVSRDTYYSTEKKGT